MSDDRALIDAHHHVWDLARRAQPWLDVPAHTPINRSFRPGDLRSAATRPIAGRSLAATVVVQCVASVDETRELLALADGDPLLAAVVGWADLTSPALGDVLDELREGAGGGRLRALRHLVQDETDPDWLQRPAVERGLRTLQARGLGYDILIRSHQFPEAIRLARRFPELPVVLDHAGKPPLADGELSDWERNVRVLAGFPHVRCKVSGLVTEADHEKWSAAGLRPVWEVLADAFGADRLMFGSDWPVCVLAGGWNRWASAMDEFLTGASPGETDAVLRRTAARFYGLSDTEPREGTT
ncbi:amidohydrolase family protein [Streptomyces shenzhenensis]|uniref:amidohydrolase family protein n=1 Tax=Streptomyces shenzhenensis TaxID=943815 RepID=UPI001F247214|nr:amidohydrolase family protein [Streptomyces shenzhenensis]